MALGISEDLQQEPSRRRIPVAELAHEGRIRGHLLPFEHEVLHNHLPQRRALLGMHAHARRLRRDLDRAIEGDAPSLLHALGQHIGVVEFQRRVGFNIAFEARRKEGDRHIGMLLLL